MHNTFISSSPYPKLGKNYTVKDVGFPLIIKDLDFPKFLNEQYSWPHLGEVASLLICVNLFLEIGKFIIGHDSFFILFLLLVGTNINFQLRKKMLSQSFLGAYFLL